MRETFEVGNRQHFEQIFEEIQRVDTLRVVVGNTLNAAELGIADLKLRVGEFDQKLQGIIGLYVSLATSELFEYKVNNNNPQKITPSDFDKLVRCSGILKGFAVFDRVNIPASQVERDPWNENGADRLEICFVIAPDDTGGSTSDSRTILVPIRKTEGHVAFYEPNSSQR